MSERELIKSMITGKMRQAGAAAYDRFHESFPDYFLVAEIFGHPVEQKRGEPALENIDNNNQNRWKDSAKNALFASAANHFAFPPGSLRMA